MYLMWRRALALALACLVASSAVAQKVSLFNRFGSTFLSQEAEKDASPDFGNLYNWVVGGYEGEQFSFYGRLQFMLEAGATGWKDKVLERISAGDASASAAVRAERNSNLHWILVYLSLHPEWTGDAVVVELRGKQAYCLIPSLAQETLLTPRSSVQLNQVLQVKAGNINIPALSVTFQEV